MEPHPVEAPARSPRRVLAAYGLMLAAGAGIGLALLAGGGRGDPSGAVRAVAAQTAGHGSTLVGVLVALASVTLAARAVGAAFSRWLRQPAVIGEIVAGILLGPSALGAAWPAASRALIAPEAVPHLGMLASVGVVLFMFVVGTELDAAVLRRNASAALTIAHAGIVAPFVLGVALARWLHPRYGVPGVPFAPFALFFGASLSVTALPILARVLSDRGLHRTPLGATALACAAVADVTAWALLAVVVGVARANVADATSRLPWVAAYVAAMLLVARPIVRAASEAVDARGGPAGRGALAAAGAGILLSAAATEALGVHALFGAFLFGALFPRDGRLARDLRRSIEDLVVVLFLPAFFVTTGARTQIGLMSGAADLLACAAIMAAATAGKFGATVAAARFTGDGWRGSLALGALMNMRGLMELIVLNVGLELGVISPRVFTMLVLMALVTTLATSPALAVILPHGEGTPEPPADDAG